MKTKKRLNVDRQLSRLGLDIIVKIAEDTIYDEYLQSTKYVTTEAKVETLEESLLEKYAYYKKYNGKLKQTKAEAEQFMFRLWSFYN